MKYGILLIDFDGVIIDTESILYESWRKVFSQYGINLHLADWIRYIRPEKPHAAAYYYLYNCLSSPPSPEQAQTMQRQFEQKMMTDCQLRPGILELLVKCKKKRLPVAVVSSSENEWITPQLKKFHLDEYIEFVVSSNTVLGKKKPDPAGYYHALNSFGCKPYRAIALEDSPWGIRSAKNAGISVVAFPNPITQYLDLSSADQIISEPCELIRIVNYGFKQGEVSNYKRTNEAGRHTSQCPSSNNASSISSNHDTGGLDNRVCFLSNSKTE